MYVSVCVNGNHKPDFSVSPCTFVCETLHTNIHCHMIFEGVFNYVGVHVYTEYFFLT